MDTTFVYNVSDISMPDTISAVIMNFPEEVNLSDKTMSLYNSMQTQLVALNSRIDSLYVLLQQRSIDGWGIDQIVSIVAIPLIIAIFAFTLPLLSSATAKIETIYQCEAITAKLEKSWQRRLYMWSLLICLGILILMLMIPSLISVCVWILPFITLILVLSVLVFYQEVGNFGKPYWIIKQLQNWYTTDCKTIYMQNLLFTGKRKILHWTRKKDKVYLKVFKFYEHFNSYDPYNYADKKFYDRLYALLRVAVKTNDIELMYNIDSKWNQQIEQSKLRSFEKKESFYYANELFYFHERALSLLGQCDEPKFHDIAIRNLCTTFDHVLLPSENYLMGVLRALVLLPHKNGVNMVRHYMFRANRMYKSIRMIPQMSYVIGEDVGSKKDKELKCIEEWNWIQNVHYLLAAYWWNKGGFELLSAACPLQEYKYYFDLFPVSSVDVLYQHIYAINAIEYSTEGISEWQIGELFDVSKEEMIEIVNRYTVFLMYYTAHREKTYYPEAIAENVLNKLDGYVEKILNMIEDKKVLLSLESIHFDTSGIDIVSTINESFQILVADIQADEYDKEINNDIFNQLQHLLTNSKQAIKLANVDGIYREDDAAFQNGITLNRCSLKVDKPFFTQKVADENTIYQTSQNISRILANRYMYVWLNAVSQMQVKTIECDALHFNEQLIQYTKGNKDLYIIVSFDSPYEVVLYPYYPKEFSWIKISKYLYSYCNNTKLFKENDQVIYVMRREDLPTIQYEQGYDHSECTIMDDSSRKGGDLTVRFEIDPHLILRYNKSAKVLKIKSKKTRI